VPPPTKSRGDIKLFENNVLRRTLGKTRDEIIGG
jgi:hypothetical protein